MNEEILNNLNERLDETLNCGRNIVEDDELTEYLDQLKHKAEKVIQEHPVKSMAGGLMAGYVLGKLLSSDD